MAITARKTNTMLSAGKQTRLTIVSTQHRLHVSLRGWGAKYQTMNQ